MSGYLADYTEKGEAKMSWQRVGDYSSEGLQYPLKGIEVGKRLDRLRY